MSLHDALDILFTVTLLALAGVYLHRTLVQRHSACSITVKDTGVFPAATTVTGMSAEEALDALRRVDADRAARAEARRLQAEQHNRRSTHDSGTASDHSQVTGKPLKGAAAVKTALDAATNICQHPDCAPLHGVVTDTNSTGLADTTRFPVEGGAPRSTIKPEAAEFEPTDDLPPGTAREHKGQKIVSTGQFWGGDIKDEPGQRSPGRNIDPTPEDDES